MNLGQFLPGESLFGLWWWVVGVEGNFSVSFGPKPGFMKIDKVLNPSVERKSKTVKITGYQSF